MSHRTKHIVVGRRMHVLWRQTVGRQDHLAVGGACQMNRCRAVHLGAAKGKRPTVNPNQGPFVPFFPCHHRSLPRVLLDALKLTTPRTWIQAGRQFDGLSDLLGRGMCNIATQRACGSVRMLQPGNRGFRPMFEPRHQFKEYTGYRFAVPSLCGLSWYNQRSAKPGLSAHSGWADLAASKRARSAGSASSMSSAVSSKTYPE